MSSTERLWQNTPLIRSSALSDKTGCEVYLKIETFQHSGSFKGRGVSHFTNQVLKAYLRQTKGEKIDTGAIATDAIKVDVSDWPQPVDTSGIPKEKLPHLVIASAGNAGLAAASAARILGVRCTIFVPDEQANIVGTFERHNTNGTVEVRVGGVNYAAAAKAAKAFAEELGERGVFVPAYDDPLVWQGNSTIMHEIAEQLPPDTKPDAIFCSVGGAGLIAGLILGCESIPGYQNVPIVGLEPHGSAAFYHSVQRNRDASSRIPEGSTETQVLVNNPFDSLVKGQYGTELLHEQRLVQLGSVVSRASSLGASAASLGAVTIGLRRRGPLYCVTVSDERAMDAALKFADDHCVVSELACSITLVPAYTPKLLNRLVPASSAISNGLQKKPVLVFVVCGGSKGSFHDLCKFEKELKNWNSLNDEVWVDGTRVEL